MDNDVRPTILVTGFGPFGEHTVNASWEAVKQLTKLPIESCHNVDLITKEIPVAYHYICNQVQHLWREFDPMLVIHVGVSHKADCLDIESRAHSIGYCRLDICNKYPDENGIVPCVIETGIDVQKICDQVNMNSQRSGCKARVSHDAGRYLCEYTFYQSLCIQPLRTLFVHVPDFKVYSSIQTANGLSEIIRYAIEYLECQ